MLTTTCWRLLDRAVEFKRHLQLAANSTHHSPFFLFIQWWWYSLFWLWSAHFDQYSLNAVCQTMQKLFFESTSLGMMLQDNHKLQSDYKIRSRSKILRAYRDPCPPVCANWVNWPFRDQHHAAMYLYLASIFFLASKYHASYSSEINITLLCT